MLNAETAYINEEFYAESVTPAQLDKLLSVGWRHFGTHFFRYSIGIYNFDIRHVVPLRIRLADFALSKSQRRVLTKNADVSTIIKPAEVTVESEFLFHRHKKRFEHSVPDSIYDFVSEEPASVPCEAKQIAVYREEKLIAASYFDVGKRSISGIYAMFDPDHASRGLGIFTMLKEIELAIDHGLEFYYQGYCYEGESFYDYKKRFRATEAFDWNGNWAGFEESA